MPSRRASQHYRQQADFYFPSSNSSFAVEPEGEIVAGLSDLCEINLRRFFGGSHLRTISRLHFKLVFVEDAGFAIVDLASTNGTCVNDRALQPGACGLFAQW